MYGVVSMQRNGCGEANGVAPRRVNSRRRVSGVAISAVVMFQKSAKLKQRNVRYVIAMSCKIMRVHAMQSGERRGYGIMCVCVAMKRDALDCAAMRYTDSQCDTCQVNAL